MFLDNLAKKEKIGVILAIIIVCFALVDRLVVNPINNRIKLIGQDIKVNEKELSLGMRNLSQKEIIQKQYFQNVSNLQNSGSDEETIAGMLSRIEGLARITNVSLVDIKPQSTQKIDFYKQYNVEITIEATMEDIVRFIYQLNAAPELLRVEKLRLNLKDKKSPYLKALVNISRVCIP